MNNKIIKLIYDKYENNIGILFDENNELIIDKNKILDKIPIQINNNYINKDRKINIYSWGKKNYDQNIDCDFKFDLTNFQTKIDKDVDVHNLTGLCSIIQDSIIKHPKFLELLEIIINTIETENPNNIGFFCNYGKHRSVGWCEIIKNLYYKNAKITHLCKNIWTK